MRYPRSAGSQRRGQVAALLALSLVALLGITAMAIDGGMMFANRRNIQAAADAAALAAAIQMFNDWNSQSAANQGRDSGGTAATSAKKTSKDNGFEHGVNNVTVTVNIPPLTGNSVGMAGYAEVTINMQQDRFFSSIFGSGSLPIQGRAVARGAKTSPGIGILVLNPTANNSFQMSGTGSVNVSGGSVVVDSSSTTGLHLSAAGSLTADSIITSSPSTPGYSRTASGTVNGTVQYNQQPTLDPLASFAASNTPTTSGVTDYGSVTIGNPAGKAVGFALVNNGHQYGVVTGTNSVTIYPGYYSSDFTINGGAAGVNVTMQTGVYIFGHNVTFQQTGTLNSGVGGTLFYVGGNGGVTNSSTNFVMNLSPMTSGTYSNPAIAIWQNVNNSSQFNLSAGGNLNITTGIIYLPNNNAILRLSASAGTTAQAGSQIIAGEIALTNSGSINVNVAQPGAPGRNLYLTE